MLNPSDNPEKIFTSTDANWGCTIRVGQMMLCQALMRHTIGEDLVLDAIINDYLKSQQYRRILRTVMDNDET